MKGNTLLEDQSPGAESDIRKGDIIVRYLFNKSISSIPASASLAINEKAKAVVCTTLTTFDEDLCRILEPHVCTTQKRLEMLKTMREHGIHTGVWLCPILPFLNDTEENLRGLLGYCFDAGVEVIVNFGMGVTLRDGDRQYFYAQLDKHFPGMKERYIRAFGERYECASPNARRLAAILREECAARNVICGAEKAMAWLMEFEDRQAGEQISLFS